MLGIFSKVIGALFAVLFSYQLFYVLVSLFCKEKKAPFKLKYHNYAVLICARNEAAVIGDLLDSLRNQTYPDKLYRVFVMADNCNDRTADISRGKSAVVYERHNTEFIGKGYALAELMHCIKADYGECFDGFLVFDADNILKPDYLEQMNISFCKGNRIIAGYINSKNYGSNWISAGYSLFLLHKSRFLNNARHILRLSAAVNGTGFLFAREIIGEWNYHTLTEDIEFTVDQVCKNNRIAYCGRAILYDEQPTSLKQSYYQRLRWAKGYIQVNRKYGTKLARGMTRGSFACFDMLNTILSAYSLSMVTLLGNAIALLGIAIMGLSIAPFIKSLILCIARAYICLYVVGLLPTITEWRMINSKPMKKILYTFTYPLFVATYYPIAFMALFKKVTWVPTKHIAYKPLN